MTYCLGNFVCIRGLNKAVQPLGPPSLIVFVLSSSLKFCVRLAELKHCNQTNKNRASCKQDHKGIDKYSIRQSHDGKIGERNGQENLSAT